MRANLMFCSMCGSHDIDLYRWKDRHTAIIRCSTCGAEGIIQGFTVGHSDLVSGESIGEAYGNVVLPVATREAIQ